MWSKLTERRKHLCIGIYICTAALLSPIGSPTFAISVRALRLVPVAYMPRLQQRVPAVHPFVKAVGTVQYSPILARASRRTYICLMTKTKLHNDVFVLLGTGRS